MSIRALALDIGTSSVRASLYDEDGQAIPGATARLSQQVRYLPDGGVELDARALLERVGRVLDGCLEASPGPVAAVGISCFWHSLLGLDGAGEPCSPLLLWADTRSAADAAELARRLDPEDLRRRTGCRPHTSYLPAKLLWIQRAHPEWWERARHWVSFGEYLLGQWTGELVSSVSMASASGLWDQRAERWDADVLDAVNLPPSRLPAVADLDEPSPCLRQARRWPALGSARWLLPVGDGACNNVGSGAIGTGRLALMIGTSGAVRRLRAGGPWTVPEALWQYRLDRRRGVVGGALSNGGNLRQWLVDVLRLPDGELDQALDAMPPGGHGLVFLPLLAGERSPGWAQGATGAVVGLRESTGALDLLRAGLESVALRFAALVDILGGAEEIIASGGGVWNSPAWARILADAVGVDLQRSAEAEPSSRGAALLALEACGAIQDVAALDPPLVGVMPANRERHDVYRAMGARLERLYALLRADALVGFAEAAGGSG